MDVTDTVQLYNGRLANAPAEAQWNVPDVREPRIHRIHGYPAKFPAFLTTKALEYTRSLGHRPKRIADIFCGCGTVAQEARHEGLEFWGCDINPVATLIARTKSASLRPARLAKYFQLIMESLPAQSFDAGLSNAATVRLQRWFTPDRFEGLSQLLNAIRAVVPERSHYRDAFYCAFSAILKSCSYWRQRSIKPAFDCRKIPADVRTAFENQCSMLIRAFAELPAQAITKRPEILQANVLTVEPSVPVDLIVTSPPYVTSYEYADLHQLSSLWLGYTDDHRVLRAGSIGSTQHKLNLCRDMRLLNRVGTQVVFSLYNHDRRAAQAVANYYLDMQRVARRCLTFLARDGIAVFVIGNTRYSGVDIDNAAHLTEALLNAGFSRVRAAKRTISNKVATPYRSYDGRFSREKTFTSIYDHEYILIAHQ
jgi:methylase of polypeptide subunit release factors